MARFGCDSEPLSNVISGSLSNAAVVQSGVETRTEFVDNHNESGLCECLSPIDDGQMGAISKADLSNFMAEMKIMIAGTNRRVGMLESKLVDGNMNGKPQKQVEEVGDNLMTNEKTEAYKTVTKTNQEMAVETLMSDIRALMAAKQNSSTSKGMEAAAQNSGKNGDANLSAMLQDVRSILIDDITQDNVCIDAESKAKMGVNGERVESRMQQRDPEVALASDRSSINALASVRRRTMEDVTSAEANGSSRRDAVLLDNQCNNNADQIRRGAEDLLNIDSLRNNADIVNLAARRLAELGMQETQDQDSRVMSGSAGKGKKSGAVSKATDKVVKDVDWPHYHVTRGADLLPSGYDELSLDEFCLGYIRMLRDADSKFNLHVMLEILEDLLEDTVDFSWKNVKGYYRSLGLDVEKGKVNWEDTAAIQKRRFTKCRVFKPTTKSSSEIKFAKTMPQGGSCCKLFQAAECDRESDHYPYVHACLYCWQHKKALYKHNESQCFSKAKETKN